LNEAKQELYIMLELVDCDLSYIISTRQGLTEAHLKCFLKQMLEGLKAMHSLRILRTCHNEQHTWKQIAVVLMFLCFDNVCVRSRFEAGEHFGVQRCVTAFESAWLLGF
jgi:hypothetical protein